MIQVFSTPNRRLPLQFSPNNIFCKPAYGDQQSATGILVKVRIRRSKNKNKIQQQPTVSIVAMLDTFYEFDCKFLLLKLMTSRKLRLDFLVWMNRWTLLSSLWNNFFLANISVPALAVKEIWSVRLNPSLQLASGLNHNFFCFDLDF